MNNQSVYSAICSLEKGKMMVPAKFLSFYVHYK